MHVPSGDRARRRHRTPPGPAGFRGRQRSTALAVATVAVVVVALSSWGATSLDGGSGTRADGPSSTTPSVPGPTAPSTTTAPATTSPTTVAPPATTPATVPAASARPRTVVRSTPARSVAGTVPAAATTPGAATAPEQGSISYASTAPDPPSADLPATPNLAMACRGGGSGTTCLDAALQAFDSARAGEGIGPLTLPSDFQSLTAGEQLLVLVDSERVDRGLAPVTGELDALDGLATTGAEDDSDPSFPSAGVAGVTAWAWAGNWASAGSVLSAVYEWMYDDGLGSGNIDCTAADTSGCWDHRDNILGFQNDIDAFGGALSFGGAAVQLGSAHGAPSMSVTTLMTWSPDIPTDYTYTWADAVAAGAS